MYSSMAKVYTMVPVGTCARKGYKTRLQNLAEASVYPGLLLSIENIILSTTRYLVCHPSAFTTTPPSSIDSLISTSIKVNVENAYVPH